LENKYIQLMILLAAGEIDSCKWNAREMYKRLEDEYVKSQTHTQKSTGGTGFSSKWNRDDTYQYVNIALLYVKCLLIDSKEHIEAA
jgi:hypothetical protein